MSEIHTEPKLIWTRAFAVVAFLHFIVYTGMMQDVNDSVLKFDGFVILVWALGSNGRSVIVDSIRAFANNKNKKD